MTPTADTPPHVFYGTEPLPPRYAIYHAELHQAASPVYRTPEGPLYLGAFLTPEAREEHARRQGYVVTAAPIR